MKFELRKISGLLRLEAMRFQHDGMALNQSFCPQKVAFEQVET